MLADILDLAKLVREQAPGTHARMLAKAVIDTLGVGFPCGFAKPEIVEGANGPLVVIAFESGTELEMTREEALGIAAAIARCALDLPEGK